jgi:hypothetical protein
MAVALIAGGCGGEPRDLGTVTGPDPLGGQEPTDWRLVEVEGIAPCSDPIQATAVEVEPDGVAATVFFQGGDPECYAVTGITIERHDPDPPSATVGYGLRLGHFGCNAALAFLAIKIQLFPALQPAG